MTCRQLNLPTLRIATMLAWIHARMGVAAKRQRMQRALMAPLGEHIAQHMMHNQAKALGVLSWSEATQAMNDPIATPSSMDEATARHP